MAASLSSRVLRTLTARHLLATRRFSTKTSAGLVQLSFGAFKDSNPSSAQLTARIFDTPTGRAFLDSCPHRHLSLSTYGAEVYGELRLDLPSTRRQPQIPPGGLAYSLQGSYLCVFFGQTPAWPVDYIGQIDEGWDVLRNASWQSLSVERVVE